MSGLSLNKSRIFSLLKPSTSWAKPIARPGNVAVSIKSAKTKDHTDYGLQMLTGFSFKKFFSSPPYFNRLDLFLLNSKKSVSLKEAQFEIKKGTTSVNGRPSVNTKSVLPPYSVIVDNSSLSKPLAHSIKNIFPSYPNSLRVNNNTSIFLRSSDGV